MRLAAALAMVAAATSAMAEDGASPNAPYASDGTLIHHAGGRSPAFEDLLCRKDHAGLTLAAAEPESDVQARFAAALAAGGGFIEAEIIALDCAYCAHALEAAFASRPEIAAARADGRAARIRIVTRPGAVLDDREIRKIARRRGYELAEIRRDDPLARP
jgi:hypothetical protein